MFHLSDFISSPLDPALQASIDELPHFPQHMQHCLIAGPERWYKRRNLVTLYCM
jgi:hypothetical protein